MIKYPNTQLASSRRPPSREKSAIHDQTKRKGAGILLLCTKTKRLLLGRRGTDCSSPETWAPFGGMVDPGETPFEAAIREVREEAGIEIPSNYSGLVELPLYVNIDEASGFQFYTYVCFVNEEPQVTINEESSGYCWFRANDLPEKLHPGFQELLESNATRYLLRTLE